MTNDPYEKAAKAVDKYYCDLHQLRSQGGNVLPEVRTRSITAILRSHLPGWVEAGELLDKPLGCPNPQGYANWLCPFRCGSCPAEELADLRHSDNCPWDIAKRAREGK